MAQIVADRVKETSTTTGTGPVTLAGTLTGYRAFSSVCSNGDVINYTIQAVDAGGNPTGDWEVGRGTWGTGGIITRTTTLASSNGNALVSFAAGAKHVWLDVPADQISSFVVNPMTTIGDIIAAGASGVPIRIAGNGTTAMLYLTQVNGVLSWQPVSAAGNLPFLFINAASDISGYKQAVSQAQYVSAAEGSVSASVTTTATLLGSFATNSGYPNVTTIPAGVVALHWDTAKGAGSNNYYTYAEIYKRTTAGTETLLATSENSSQYSDNTRKQIRVTALINSAISLNLTDRIIVKIYAIMVSSTATITVYFDGNTNSGVDTPSPVVDATNFIPYLGATRDVDLGAKNINASDFKIENKSIITTVFDVSTTGYGAVTALPDATTMALGNVRIYQNNGGYDRKITDNSGNVLGFIPAVSSAIVVCSNNSTTAGIWDLSNVKMMGVTAKKGFITSGTSSAVVNAVVMDSNRQMLIIGGTSAYGVIYNRTTNEWGNITLIRSGIKAGAVIATSAGGDNVLILTVNTAGTGLEAVVAIGTDTSIGFGTAVPYTLAGAWDTWGSLISVGSAFVFGYTRLSVNATATRVVTITGTTPDVGAEDTLSVVSSAPVHLYANSTTTYTAILGDFSSIKIKTNSFSGNIITPGTEISTACNAATIRSMALPSGRIAILYRNTTTYGGIISVSGTTPSLSAVEVSAGTAVMNSIDWVLVSASKIAVAAAVPNTSQRFNHLIDTSGAASAGTEVIYSANSPLGNSSLVGLVGGIAKFTITQNNASEICLANCDTSGTSPVVTINTTPISSTMPIPVAPVQSKLNGGKVDPSVLPHGINFIKPSPDYLGASYLFSGVSVYFRETAPVFNSINVSGHNAQEFWSCRGSSTGVEFVKVEVAP